MFVECNSNYKTFDEFEKAMLALGPAMTGVDSIDINETHLDKNFVEMDEWHCGMSFLECGLDIYCEETNMSIICDDEQLTMKVLLLIKGFSNSESSQAITIPPETYGIREQRWAKCL